jgi:hypothetical protein
MPIASLRSRPDLHWRLALKEPADLLISAHCPSLPISRSSFCHAPQPESEETLPLMRVIDPAFTWWRS